MNDRVYEYVNPLFKELMEMTPIEKRRESTISSGIAVRIAEILNRKGWNPILNYGNVLPLAGLSTCSMS